MRGEIGVERALPVKIPLSTGMIKMRNIMLHIVANNVNYVPQKVKTILFMEKNIKMNLNERCLFLLKKNEN